MKVSDQQHKLSKFFYSALFYHLIALTVILIANIALYHQSLSYPLVYDSIGKIDLKYFYPGYIQDFSILANRWVLFVSLWFDHLIHNSDPYWFRFANVILHSLTSYLLFIFIKQLLSLFILPKVQIKLLPKPILAILLAFIFSIHPMGIYATVNIIQRSIILATLFSLASLICFIASFKSKQTLNLLGATLFYFLAIHSKEHAVMIPAIHLSLLVLHPSQIKNKRPFYIALSVMLAMATQITIYNQGTLGKIYEPKTQAILLSLNANKSQFSLWALSAINQTWHFFKYLGLWFIPLPQFMGIDLASGYPKSPFSYHIFGFMGYLSLLSFCLWGFIKRKSLTLFFLGLWIPLILFLPEFSTIRMHETFILYRSYLWMIGLYLTLPLLLSKIQKRQQIMLLGIWVLILFSVFQDRIQTFQSSLILWKDSAHKIDYKQSNLSLNAYRPYASVGGHLAKIEKHKEAIEYYKKAIQLSPQFYNLHNSLGVSLILTDQKKEAIKVLKKSIEYHAKHPMAYYNLGSLYYELGDVDKAGDYFLKTTQLNPKHDSAFYHLAKIHFIKQDFKHAEQYYRQSITLNPKQPKALEQLAQVLANQQRFKESLQLLIKALLLDPQSQSIKSSLIKVKDAANKNNDTTE